MSRSISACVLKNGCKSDYFCSLLERIGGQRNGKKEYVFKTKEKYIWLFYIEDENNTIREIEVKLSSTHDNYNYAIDLIKKISVSIELLIDIVGEKKFSPSEFCLIQKLSRDNFEPDDDFFIFSKKIIICLSDRKYAQKMKEHIDCMWEGVTNVKDDMNFLELFPVNGVFYKKDEDILMSIFNKTETLTDINIYATVRFYLKNKHINLLYDIY